MSRPDPYIHLEGDWKFPSQQRKKIDLTEDMKTKLKEGFVPPMSRGRIEPYVLFAQIVKNTVAEYEKEADGKIVRDSSGQPLRRDIRKYTIMPCICRLGNSQASFDNYEAFRNKGMIPFAWFLPHEGDEWKKYTDAWKGEPEENHVNPYLEILKDCERMRFASDNANALQAKDAEIEALKKELRTKESGIEQKADRTGSGAATEPRAKTVIK